ncbi:MULTISPECIES: MarR family winged helix-turn-helix transcriptional regulator [Paracoccus]|uniref:MarR family transcriptional regulator n=1 Tax=Paracoccus kondratievae TaxID=135740 RepID=A0AAD3RUY3_9RHOB|nr:MULTISPECIES: MarR family transcriptional regulator [Paracoccus]GLK65129.1 MarR family transcriptional regulator [Paracoccus kondratievae]SMG33854.1 DNA-binding transcriptional regulator, MarR family [Paracoccus sp. J56]
MSRDLERFTPYLMNRIMARYNRGVEEILRTEGVSVVQMRTLAVLLEHGPQTVNDLSVLTVVKQSTLSRTLDQIEALGLIRRELDPSDSRLRIICATEAGAALHAKVWPAMLAAQDRLLAALDASQREHLNDLLTHILRSIRHHDF